LNDISQNGSGVQINWEQSLDGNFHSYKLYRHSSSGIDENSGELIHTSTSLSDVSFIDSDFSPLQTYFYRVYVLNDNGLSNGSNVKSITTQTISLIDNGSFELGNNIPTGWTLVQNNINEPLNSIVIETTNASDGMQCLNFHHNSSPGCYEMWISQYVSLASLTPGGTYEFSFSYMSDIPNTTGPSQGFKISNATMNISLALPYFQGDGIWHNFSAQFTLPDNIGNSDPKVMIHFCNNGIIDWKIDDVSVVKV